MTNHRERQHAVSCVPSAPETPEETLTEPGSLYQAEVLALRQELETLRAEFAAFRAAMASTASPESTALPTAAHTVATRESEQEPSGSMTTRRMLLKWGGLGAAAAIAAAGGATLTGQTAHAADGANLVLGTANTAESPTHLTYDGTGSAATGLTVDTGTSQNSTALSVTAGDTSDNSSYSYGIYAVSGSGLNSYGVYGQAGNDGVGVEGSSSGPSAYGVWGYVPSGFGIVGESDTGIDIAAGGAGRLFQRASGFAGAPTVGSYLAGEQIRDLNGDLYICVADGTPGTWKKVAALNTTYKGGAIGFLSSPIRVYDSRVTGGQLVGNAARSIQITNVVINNVKVPAGATGCIGNLTVYHPTSGGYLVIYPQGSPTPSSSTVNYVAGQTIPNSFTVGLSSSGQVTVHAFQSGSCHFIVDITGFVA